ncbi:MAG TPA: hypothetical protein VEB66_13135 [Opitutaceae bacterium]|nr:hypothetical protein [Opitutaceae bacterium]
MPIRSLRSALLLVALAPALPAQPLSRSFEVDFSREVLSRNLQGLAVRSDGRLLPGPAFKDLEGPKIADILWCLEPAGGNRFLVGTGPEGQVQEVTFNPADNTYASRSVADVEETQVVSVLPLPDGTFLFGTSPTAALYLAKDGAIIARVPLPADSVFDLLALPGGAVLAATGNPGKVYRIDVAAFAKSGIAEGKADKEPKDAAAAAAELSAKGVSVFGEVRDRNLRRLARLADGRIAAGSSPRGTIYVFPAPGAAGAKSEPVILHEQRDAEVVDLLPEPDGGLYAAFVSSPSEDSRIAPRVTALTPPATPPPTEPRTTPAFSGRSTVLKIAPDGFAETAALRNNIALYRLARHNGWLLFAAGEQGDAFGYDPAARRSLTFAGSASAQLNDLVPLGGGRHLVLRNNAPGLALLSFAPPAARELETKRLDLGGASELGNLRFERFRDLPAGALKVEARTNHGSDEVEGWTPWTELKPRDGAWYAENLRGRYVKLRLTFQGAPESFQLEKATLYHLPQNRRPQLSDFRIFPPNLGLLPQSEQQPANVVATLNQWLSPGGPAGSGGDGERRKNPFLNSQVVPAPGTQLVYWSVTDPDSDTLAYTFSIRPEKSEAWTDVAARTRESFAQFEVSHLAEGLYLTRLKVVELGPRPPAQRLDYVFETDALLVDRTPPALAKSEVTRTAEALVVSVTGRDALSLLEGAQFNFNNGVKETLVHPSDGIRDGREETFVAEIPLARAAGATSVEVIVFDQAGNALSTRLEVN